MFSFAVSGSFHLETLLRKIQRDDLRYVFIVIHYENLLFAHRILPLNIIFTGLPLYGYEFCNRMRHLPVRGRLAALPQA